LAFEKLVKVVDLVNTAFLYVTMPNLFRNHNYNLLSIDFFIGKRTCELLHPMSGNLQSSPQKATRTVMIYGLFKEKNHFVYEITFNMVVSWFMLFNATFTTIFQLQYNEKQQ
jgi:hypothetical protein